MSPSILRVHSKRHSGNAGKGRVRRKTGKHLSDETKRKISGKLLHKATRRVLAADKAEKVLKATLEAERKIVRKQKKKRPTITYHILRPAGQVAKPNW